MDDKIKKLVIGDFSFKRLLRSVALIVVINYVFLLFYACVMADKAMFPAPSPSYVDGPGIVKLALPDGTEVSCLTVRKPSTRHIIYSHGNAVDLGIIGPQLDDMALMTGISITCYDYPGYGTSTGNPSEESTCQALLAAYDHVRGSGVPADKIIIWGRSIGTGPSVWLASRNPVGGLILETPFTSAFRVVTRVKILPFDRFPNIDRIQDVKCPVLVIHGTRDSVIPFSHGKTMFLAANEPKTFVEITGAGHNDLEWVGGSLYWDAIRVFLASLNSGSGKSGGEDD